MQPIVYDIAVSLDGFIAGPSGDISQFDFEGPVVTDYQERLQGYTTVLMGRHTYEFGYQYGLRPGQNPYPHMKTIVVSDTLDLPQNSDVSQLQSMDEDHIRALKQSSQGPIYLCGGGAMAGSLLRLGMIDKLILKRAPCIYGGGVGLFGGECANARLERTNSTVYDSGYTLEEFVINEESK